MTCWEPVLFVNRMNLGPVRWRTGSVRYGIKSATIHRQLPVRQPGKRLGQLLTDLQVLVERRPRHSEPLHLVDQRCAFQPQPRGCAVPSSNHPSS